MKAMTCRSCGSALAAEDIDRRLAIISCGHCGAIFDLTSNRIEDSAQEDSSTENQRSSAGKDQSLERAPVALPEKFLLTERVRGFEVKWRWFKPVAIFLVFFCLCWDSFLVVWYATGSSTGEMPFLFYVFPLGHVAVGVGLTYYTVALFFNSTRVRIDQQTISVHHSPLPWYPMPTIPVGNLEQLYVTREVRHGKNGASISFSLRAVLRDNTNKKLLGGFSDLDQALWLEQRIEKTLGIRDRAVAGEYQSDDTQL